MLRVIWTQYQEKDSINNTLIISQPVVRVAPAKLAELKARFGVPQDAEEIYSDKAIFRNTELRWLERPEQMRLPV